MDRHTERECERADGCWYPSNRTARGHEGDSVIGMGEGPRALVADDQNGAVT